MTKTNGEVESTIVEGLAQPAMLEILIEAVTQLHEAIEELKELNVEILEKVNNLSTEGDGFSYDS